MLGAEGQPKPEEDRLQSQANKNFLWNKFSQIFAKHTNLKPDQAYYLEASKLYINILRVKQKVNNTKVQIAELKSMIGFESSEKKKLPQNSQSQPVSEDSNSQRRKRIRRTANQIARHYICEVQKCHKSYGSQGSLNQHMKLKHNELYTKSMLFFNFNQS